MVCSGFPIGHWVKTIVFGLGSNFFDVYSDVGSGIYHQQPKNVTRTFLSNDTVPNNCFGLTNSTTEADQTYVCMEEDIVWATITFGCIQLPAVVLTLCGVVGMVMFEGCSRIPSSIDHSVPPSSAPTTSRQCLHARLCPDGVVELHLPLRRGSS